MDLGLFPKQRQGVLSFEACGSIFEFGAVFAEKQGGTLKKSLWVEPAGQKPNTINPDLVK